MIKKFSWSKSLVLTLMLLPLFIGLVARGWDVLGWGFWLAVIYAIVFVLFIGLPLARNYYLKNGPKGLLIGIIIILVLIPLAFLGTCGLVIGGSYLQQLF